MRACLYSSGNSPAGMPQNGAAVDYFRRVLAAGLGLVFGFAVFGVFGFSGVFGVSGFLPGGLPCFASVFAVAAFSGFGGGAGCWGAVGGADGASPFFFLPLPFAASGTAAFT